MMVASLPRDSNPNPNRPPLLPSERDINGGANPNPKRPKSKTVSSRYLLSPATSSSSSSNSSNSSSLTSFSTPRRCPSPLVSRNSTPVPKSRSLSVDRRRPSTPQQDPAATKQLFTATRSLSVSFQGEAFSLPISRTKAAPAPSPAAGLRRGTPERRRPGTPASENPKRPDQHRWPARIRQVSPNTNCGNSSLNSFDSSIDGKQKLNVLGSDDNKLGIELNDKLGLDLDNSELLKSIRRYADGVSNEASFPSDSDSVSSGSSNSGRTVGSAKYWQETYYQTPLPKCPSKMTIPPKFGQPKKFPMETPMASPRTVSSPMRGSVRPSSPSRPRASIDSLPSRGTPSPSRVRSSISNCFSETPSVLSFAVDVKRGKVGENQMVDAHTLRILYNRQLQWRFVNARNEAVLSAQRRSVQKNLWNAWITISNLRDSVTRKTHLLHLLKHKLKLASILKDQITYLENWASLDKGHCMSLLGSIEALKGSTLRLPVVGGAIADLQSIKDAIGSAVDVMQAMAFSIRSLFLKVEEMNSLASELTKEMSKEQALLEECKGNFTTMAALQVEYCSLRTHVLQVNRIRIP